MQSEQLKSTIVLAQVKFKNGSDLWVSDNGIYLTSSSSVETHPSLNIEIEIMTLKQLEMPVNVEAGALGEVERFIKDKFTFVHKQLNGNDHYINECMADYTCDDIITVLPEDGGTSKLIESRISCSNCGERFVSNNTMNDSLKSELDTLCDKCSTDYKSGTEDVNSTENEDMEDNHKCDTCYKAFPSKSDLKKHILTHFISKHSSQLSRVTTKREGDNQFTCDVCNKTFSQRSNLTRHLFSHRGEKPFACDICDKKFTQKFTLKTHKLTHDGIKDYQCDVCGKAFVRRDYLKKHKYIHADEKPFYCIYCDKQFTQKHHLVKHESTHKWTTSESETTD